MILLRNSRASYDYELLNFWEAGIALTGPEVKSLRSKCGSIQAAYVTVMQGEIWLMNALIPDYKMAHHQNQEPRRTRKLLMHKREINKIMGEVNRKGHTVIVLSLYFNNKGLIKAKIASAVGKKKEDKRQKEKERDWKRRQAEITSFRR